MCALCTAFRRGEVLKGRIYVGECQACLIITLDRVTGEGAIKGGRGGLKMVTRRVGFLDLFNVFV